MQSPRSNVIGGVAPGMVQLPITKAKRAGGGGTRSGRHDTTKLGNVAVRRPNQTRLLAEWIAGSGGHEAIDPDQAAARRQRGEGRRCREWWGTVARGEWPLCQMRRGRRETKFLTELVFRTDTARLSPASACFGRGLLTYRAHLSGSSRVVARCVITCDLFSLHGHI
jgi:hypothetical protein